MKTRNFYPDVAAVSSVQKNQTSVSLIEETAGTGRRKEENAQTETTW